MRAGRTALAAGQGAGIALEAALLWGWPQAGGPACWRRLLLAAFLG